MYGRGCLSCRGRGNGGVEADRELPGYFVGGPRTADSTPGNHLRAGLAPVLLDFEIRLQLCQESRPINAMPEGRSERLRFEPLSWAHAALLSEVLLDPAVYEFIAGPHPASTLDLAEDFQRAAEGPAADRQPMRWWNIGVFAAETGQGLGQIQATIVDDWAEIAYLFGRKHWGQGYAQEAVRWLHAKLAEDGAAGTLWATVTPSNRRSVRLLERLGYTPVSEGWPRLGSYDEGDLVYRRSCRNPS
jgi:RimJ/RimL family protein N-acetyltransferase